MYGDVTVTHDIRMQKSIYSGYKKQHGLSTLALFLPNGINYIYGPCSMRENDRWLVNRSNCNGYLMEIQNNTPSLEGRLFVAYGAIYFRILSVFAELMLVMP